ncbi:translocation/assembly module TamB domain-containing protein [Vannielia litorea]|uniref:translocation/assembly module TamB domain-containing protein n=1 Tax=Vannielia litorea TaxID=1217970 RepID=UPI001C969D4F|nr:translocation/assembly module TamB domain-containing protein [Vannielia litorea]MBY6151732.1 translocation/assembly module TamB domain-containing protein [Vannielia litorea]
MRRLALILLLLIAPFAALAQETASEEADKGYLTNLLQDVLSDAGRAVVIDGFQGALSSRATIERITIADDEGTWLTVEGVVLDWNRAALLRGRLEVSEFSAERIVMPRGPITESAPSPEATPFAIPDLPVSVDIAKLAVDRAEIGAALLGQDAVMRLAGDAHLDGGGVNVDLQLDRLDGKEGDITLIARYDPATEEAAVNLAMREGPAGIAAGKLNIPGAPALDVTLQGEGPVSDLTLRLAVASDEEERLGGTIALSASEEADAPFTVSVDLSGDVTPLFAPDLRDFFGQDISLAATVARDAEGELSLSGLSLGARTATVEGDFLFSATGWPRRMDLSLALADPAGAPVVLPFGGGDTSVSRATLELDYDEANGRGFTATAEAAGLRTTGFVAEAITLGAQGNITSGEAEEIGAIAANVTLDARGLTPEDEALARAMGEAISGQLTLAYDEGQPLRLSGLNIAGADFGLTGEATLDGVDTNLLTGLDLRLAAEDLTRFGPLAGVDLQGAAALGIKGTVALLSGAFDLGLEGTTTDLAIGQDTVDNLLAGDGRINVSVLRNEDGINLRRAEARTEVAAITADGTVATNASALNFTADLPSLAPLFPEEQASGAARLSGRVAFIGTELQTASIAAQLSDDSGTVLLPVGGGLQLSGGTLDLGYGAEERRWRLNTVFRDFVTEGYGAEAFTLQGSGTLEQTEAGGLARADGQLVLSGEGITAADADMARAIGEAAQLETTFDFAANGPFELTDIRFTSADTTLTGTATLAAPVGQGPISFDTALTTPALTRFAGLAGVPLTGAANVTAKGTYQPDAGSAQVRVDGTTQGLGIGNARVDPVLGGAGRLGADVTYATGDSLTLTNLIVALDETEVAGRTTLSNPLGKAPIAYDLTINAPALSRFSPLAGLSLTGATQATATGLFDPATGALDLALDGTAQGLGIGNATVDKLTTGNSSYGVQVSRANSDSEITIENGRFDGPNLDVTASGTPSRITLDARLANLGLLAPDFAGPATASGTITSEGGTTGLDISATGPGGTTAQVNGTITGNRGNLAITGQAPLGLANAFIAPQRLNGLATIDLRLDGPLALESLTGSIRASGARAVAPELGVSLEGINANVILSGGSARVEVAATGGQGGGVAVLGSIGLSAPQSADLTVTFRNFALRDPQLYDTSASGAITLAGPLSGGAGITGRLELGRTEIRIPSSGMTGIHDIPDITHVGASPAVRNTQDRAGLNEGGDGSGGGSGGGGLALDITLAAPNQVFVRGRGLDAELGGSLRITGTTSNIVPIGAFELVRGRLDILSQRFQLTEGAARLTGSFDANLRLVATTEKNGYTISVILEGSPSDPQITFTAAPDLPQDEILAQLIFGRDLTTLSPLQALELASAVATLAGRGGDGIMGRLRDQFGLDDLDVSQSEEGNTAVRAGKYISDNVYSDVVVESDGTTELNLNLQIGPNVNVKGSTSSDGNSGIGIFFERDY